MISLEYGKKYRNKVGDVVTLMSLDELNKRRKEAGKAELAPSAKKSDYFGVYPGLMFTAHRSDGTNFYGNIRYDLVEEVKEVKELKKLKLKLGKSYKSKNGDVWKIVTLEELNKLHLNAHPKSVPIKVTGMYFNRHGELYLGWCEQTKGWNPYRVDGTFYDAPSKYGYDLVEEIFELKLEIGKFYKTANNLKVKVLENNIPSDRDMVYAMFMPTGTVARFSKDGVYAPNKSYNIVGEWKETKKIKGWVAVVVGEHTGCHYVNDVIYYTKDEALAVRMAVGAVEIEYEYEVK